MHAKMEALQTQSSEHGLAQVPETLQVPQVASDLRFVGAFALCYFRLVLNSPETLLEAQIMNGEGPFHHCHSPIWEKPQKHHHHYRRCMG